MDCKDRYPGLNDNGSGAMDSEESGSAKAEKFGAKFDNTFSMRSLWNALLYGKYRVLLHKSLVIRRSMFYESYIIFHECLPRAESCS